MKKEITLSPEELYYLGSILGAEYMDYAYIAAMSKQGKSEELFANEAKASLVKSGILAEDFGGDLEVEEETAKLLKPIFFGKTETSVDVYINGEEADIDVYKFHFLDAIITLVTESDGQFFIREIEPSQINELAESLISNEYESGKPLEFDEKNVTRVVVAKSIKIDEISVVETFVESNGIYYRKSENGNYESLSKDTFTTDLIKTIKGE